MRSAGLDLAKFGEQLGRIDLPNWPVSESGKDILLKPTDRIVPMPFGPAAAHLGDEIERDCFERILRLKNLALLCGFAFERRIAAIGDYVPRSSRFALTVLSVTSG